MSSFMSGHLKPKGSDSLLLTKEIPSAESERLRSSTNAASKIAGEVNEEVAEADKNEASRSGMEDTETLHMAVTEIESGNQSDSDHRDADQNDNMDDGAGSPLHYGTKTGHFETLRIHFPMSEGVSKVSERVNE